MSWGGVAMGVGAAVGGIGSAYLSSKDSGGYKKKEDSPYTPAQQSLLASMTGVLKREADRGVEPPPDAVPDPTEGQEKAGEYGETFFRPDMFEKGILRTQQERGMELLEPEEWDPSQSRERWRETVMEPAQQQWEEETAPQLMEEYASRNALSSSGMSRALAESQEDIAKRGMAELADMTFQDYQAQRQRNLQRAQMGQTMLGQTLQQAQAAAQVSAIPRSIEQQQMEEDRQQELYGRAYNNPWLQKFYGPTLGVQPNQTSYISKPPSATSQAIQQAGPLLGKAIGRGVGSYMGSSGQTGGGYTSTMGATQGTQQPYGSWSRSAYGSGTG